MDPVFLSRIQFALTAGFHYIFPVLSIGLGVIMVIMEGLWIKKREPIYLQMAQFWTKIFGLTFALGVATGIVLEFEFGTNWATYSRYVGDIFGSALAAEGIFAFFLESGFLAIVLFGWGRVSPAFHYVSTWLVCLGSHFSAVWIIVANSWQQTPAGYHIVGEGATARAEVTDFWAMVFNPSSMDRLLHAVLGAWLAGAFLVLSVSAFYLLRNKHKAFAMNSIKIGLVMAIIASVLQMASGDHSAMLTEKHQPAKFAAMEGLYQTQKGAPIHPFGWVDTENQKVIGPKIPGALSFLAHRDFSAEIKGLDTIAEQNRPPVQTTFQMFHLMVAVGGLMLLIACFGVFQWYRGKLDAIDDKVSRSFLWVLVFSVLLPQIGNQAGWVVAEVGRQPWVVYGLLKTSDAVSKVVTSGEILFSLILFSGIYSLLFFLFIFLLDHKIRKGPEEAPESLIAGKRSGGN